MVGGVIDAQVSRLARDATLSCLFTVSMLGLDGVDDGVQHQRLWFSPHEFITDPTETLTL